MINSAVKFLFYLVTILLFSTCGIDQSKKNSSNEISKTDTLKKVSSEIVGLKEKAKLRPINHELNDIARYIAGLEIDEGSKLDPILLKNEDWQNYSAILNQKWERVDKTKIEKMKPWAKQELGNLNPTTLFYPFAGADFLNAYTLFPNAKQYILVGLEPFGTPPDFMQIYRTDSLPFYFNTIKRSLSSIFNFSFFRTKSMAVDFHDDDMNGTVHLILFFLERTGNSIIDIKPVAINSSGELVNYISYVGARKDSLKNKGLQIDFMSADSLEHSVFYFSVNLGNNSFAKNYGFKKFLQKQIADVTYIKSASYLMHKLYFSEIRSTILNNSRAILQDDSGIPWKIFNDTTRRITLYGTYTGVIKLFSTANQPDLKLAYSRDSLKIKPLPFGIGYKYKEDQSNLMLSVRP